MYLDSELSVFPTSGFPYESTTITPITSTKSADDDAAVSLTWLIPIVIGVVVVMLFLALGLFYCIRNLELCFLTRCPECCPCCVPEDERDENIPLHSAYGHYRESYRDDSYTINSKS
ncbi:uncharacterized protein LOC127871127 [Dreissena polymorpha]|uniref:Uncharacterized protein n=1 Tax=Dreissena polymorpha TaxID=45954 RepID=A0A9D4LDP4_DREPO|nr:uncharacterized protein LOC127871127 [Dreissena polymorpha]KAH3855904.1 hypothetical protein DPMN_098479 [Dreissena polymorpha]